MVLLRQEIGDVSVTPAVGRVARCARSPRSRASPSGTSARSSAAEGGVERAAASICGALEVPLSSVLHTVSRRVAEAEHVEPVDLEVAGLEVPDTVPDGLADGVALRDGLVNAA